MRQVLFGIRLTFAAEKLIHSLSERVFEGLGGTVTESRLVPEPGMRLRVRAGKIGVLWNPNACEVTMEDVTSHDECIETIVGFLGKINEVAPIDKLQKRVLLNYWILPAPTYDFVSLERKYRETMIVENEVTRGNRDSSVIIDSEAGEWTLHHQSGAMVPQQLLSECLKFGLEDVPKVFLFLETSIMEQKVVEYSREETRRFLRQSLDYCILHSQAFQRIWEGIL